MHFYAVLSLVHGAFVCVYSSQYKMLNVKFFSDP